MTSGGSGEMPLTRAPPWSKIVYFHGCLQQKFCKIRGWRTPLGSKHPPENPGSVTIDPKYCGQVTNTVFTQKKHPQFSRSLFCSLCSLWPICTVRVASTKESTGSRLHCKRYERSGRAGSVWICLGHLASLILNQTWVHRSVEGGRFGGGGK